MDRRLEKLVTTFKKDGLEISHEHLDTINMMDGLGPVLRELLPKQFFSYDTEVIDDVDGYYFVMSLHIEKAQPEWNPQDLKISGKTDGKIKIEFLHNGKKVIWNFEQHDSDYVSEDFYKRMDSWVSRNLAGRFIMLPTGGQDVGFIYLPKDSASTVKRLMKNFIGIDEYVDFFRSSQAHPSEDFFQLRDNPSFDDSLVDSLGETALTAAIKSKNVIQIKNIIDYEFAPITSKNSHGECPLHLAQELNKEVEIPEVISKLEERLLYHSESWKELDWAWKFCSEYTPELLELVEKIKSDNVFQQTYQCIAVLSSIWFAKSENIELGNETLFVAFIPPVRRVEKDKAFYVEYSSKHGTCNDYRLDDTTKEEALKSVYEFYGVV